MGKRTLKVLAGIGVLLLMGFAVGVTPALAVGSAVTEDNDTNDGGTPNNVSDAGDNAHPSGRDRSVENGGSGNQGNSQSDPDGDSNGGADKADGAGGIDKADQDGNNGCGNDDDFEDDNNGNCDKARSKDRPCVPVHGNGKAKGKSKGKGKGHAKVCESVKTSFTPEVCVANVNNSDHGKVCERDDSGLDTGSETPDDGVASTDDDDVLGTALVNDSLPAADSDEVLGSQQSKGGFLPFTGVGIIPILAIGGGLIALGFMFMKTKRANRS